jgi:hypothetical protein
MEKTVPTHGLFFLGKIAWGKLNGNVEKSRLHVLSAITMVRALSFLTRRPAFAWRAKYVTIGPYATTQKYEVSSAKKAYFLQQ